MSQTILHMTGPAARGLRVGASMLRDLLDVLVDAVQQSVRVRAEGRSRAAGPTPVWLDRAATFLVEIQPGSTQLVLDAQRLDELVPDKFAQLSTFEPLDPGASCLDVFVEALDDALASKADSDLSDDGLVETLARFGRVLDQEVDSFEIRNGRTRVFDRQSVDLLRQLRRSIPAGQRVRVAEAEQIVAAEGDTTLWESAPQPLFSDLETRSLLIPQGPRSGVGAIFGQWPGDEIDEDFERAVQDLS